MSDAPKKIMTLFLNQHYQNLYSISKFLNTKYDFDPEGKFPYLLSSLKKDKAFFQKIKSDSVGDKKGALVNLRNSWYNEAAFLDKSKYGVEDTKFLPWKISQFYYSIFSALSAIARCINSSENIKGHERMINYFTSQILTKPGLCVNLFPPPFCFVLTNEGSIYPEFKNVIDSRTILRYDGPRIEACLKSINSKKKKQYSLLCGLSVVLGWI
jgi:hypothetical protein